MPANKPTTPLLRRGHKHSVGLVAGYPITEAAGTAIYDASGNENTGTLTSGASLTNGQHGYCLSFNGSSHVALGTVNQPSRPPITVECWVNLTNFTGGKVIARWDDSGSKFNYLLSVTAGGAPVFTCVANSGLGIYAATGPATMVAGTWYHLVGTRDASTNVKVYLNGKPTTGAFSFNGSAVGAALWLGAGQNGAANSGAMTGLMDGVAFYNRVLSDQEVEEKYQDSFAMYRPGWRVQVYEIFVMSGGLAVGGSFPVHTESTVTMDGGLVIGGSFTIGGSSVTVMSGGLVIGGAFVDLSPMAVSLSDTMSFSEDTDRVPELADVVTFTSSIRNVEPNTAVADRVTFSSRFDVAPGPNLAFGRYRR